MRGRLPGTQARGRAVAGFVGLLLGYLGANVLLVGQWWSLVLWGAVALAIGGVARQRSGALAAAAVYGGLLVIAFMVTGYRGETALFANVGFLVLTAVLSVIGAVASWWPRGSPSLCEPGRRFARGVVSGPLRPLHSRYAPSQTCILRPFYA